MNILRKILAAFAAASLLMQPALAVPTALQPGGNTQQIDRVVQAQKILRAAARAKMPVMMTANIPTVTRPPSQANSTIITSANYAGATIQETDPRLTIVRGRTIANGAGVVGGSSGGYAVRFQTDAPKFDFQRRSITSTKNTWHRIIVDGETVPGDNVNGDFTSGADNLYHLVDFGTAKMRTIELQFGSAANFGGVNVPTTYSVWPAPLADTPRFYFIGDSYTEEQGADYLWGGWARRTAAELGVEGIIQGSGGTGYLAPTKFRDRVGEIANYPNLDAVVIAGGINDGAYTDAALQAEALALIAAIRAVQPNAFIIGVGPWNSPGRGTSVSRAAAIKAAYDTAALTDTKILYADTYIGDANRAWQTGTGRSGAPNGTGNADYYIGAESGTDQIHPTQAGHDYLGVRVARAVVALLRSITN